MTEASWRSGELLISLEATGRGEGYRRVIFSATGGGFTAARVACIDDDLELFIAGIEHMSTTQTGHAELLGDCGTEFTLKLTILPDGRVKVYVEVNHTFAELHIEDETDQTYPPNLRDALLSLA